MVLREKFQLNYDPEDLAAFMEDFLLIVHSAVFWVHTGKLDIFIYNWLENGPGLKLYFLYSSWTWGIFHCLHLFTKVYFSLQ